MPVVLNDGHQYLHAMCVDRELRHFFRDMSSLPTLGGSPNWHIPIEISEDGRMAVGRSIGSSGERGVSWVSSGGSWGVIDLGDATGGDSYSSAEAVNGTGTIAVGKCAPAPSTQYLRQIARWSVAGLEILPDISSPAVTPQHSVASGISTSGERIVGTADIPTSSGGPGVPFIWSPAYGGTKRLQTDVLAGIYGLGTAMSGLTLHAAWGISDDGGVIVGMGDNGTGDEAWIATIPSEDCEQRCPGDLNRDGIVDFADYLEFLVHLDAGC